MDIRKIYQMFILGTGNLDDALANGLGGVIFFTKDINSESQFTDLINNIKHKSIIAPFLSIDQEGGRVERTENIRPRRLSAQIAYKKGADTLKQQTEEIAGELKKYGINLNFAPCADVNTNHNNPIIGERAFSNQPDQVIEGVKIVSEIYKDYGIIPCIKHYPGHGDASQDSHKTLPIIDMPFSELEKNHIYPFKKSIEHGIDMIMAAHLHCTCFDKETIPTSLSSNAINYLRKDLNYKGVIISDDMIMNGVKQFGMSEACILGINAGLNMLIYRDSEDMTLEVIENVIKKAEKNIDLREKIEYSYGKIKSLKDKFEIK